VTGTVHVQLFGILSMLIVLFRRYVPVILSFDVVMFSTWPCGKTLVYLKSSSNSIRIKATYSQLMVPYVVGCVYIIYWNDVIFMFNCKYIFIHISLKI
jgi:hypothetical protein